MPDTTTRKNNNEDGVNWGSLVGNLILVVGVLLVGGTVWLAKGTQPAGMPVQCYDSSFVKMDWVKRTTNRLESVTPLGGCAYDIVYWTVPKANRLKDAPGRNRADTLSGRTLTTWLYARSEPVRPLREPLPWPKRERATPEQIRAALERFNRGARQQADLADEEEVRDGAMSFEDYIARHNRREMGQPSQSGFHNGETALEDAWAVRHGTMTLETYNKRHY